MEVAHHPQENEGYSEYQHSQVLGKDSGPRGPLGGALTRGLPQSRLLLDGRHTLGRRRRHTVSARRCHRSGSGIECLESVDDVLGTPACARGVAFRCTDGAQDNLSDPLSVPALLAPGGRSNRPPNRRNIYPGRPGGPLSTIRCRQRGLASQQHEQEPAKPVEILRLVRSGKPGSCCRVVRRTGAFIP